MNEIVIMDERLDATSGQVEEWVTRFLSNQIILPLGIDINLEQDGNKQIWVINPQDRSDGGDTPLLNGYFEINPLSIGRDSQAVHVRIVSYREALTPLWYDLAQYIRASILAPSLPPGALATPLSKAKLLGVEIPEPAGSEDPIPSVEESDPCSVVPKSKKQLQKWREAYEIVEESREEYKVEFLDSLIKKGTGTVADFQDAVASQMNWTVSDRTLRKIIKAGDAGCLD